MRRLVLLLSSIVAVDIMFFTALAPLLPHFVSRYGLSKGEAGVLSATYAAGVLAASLPGGMAASRLGPRQAALGGVGLTALASLGFALADNVWTLGAARLLQGIGSAFSWAGALAWLVAAAPRERRGELIGTTMGAAVFGALLGAVLGSGGSPTGAAGSYRSSSRSWARSPSRSRWHGRTRRCSWPRSLSPRASRTAPSTPPGWR